MRDPAHWQQCPSGIARPVLLRDYHSLASRLGYRIAEVEAPASVYTNTTWKHIVDEDVSSSIVCWSYANMYSMLQMKQPILHGVRCALVSLNKRLGRPPASAEFRLEFETILQPSRTSCT